MKARILVLTLVLVLFTFLGAGPAEASKARLKSLGQSVDGSFFILDSRDIFLDPAAISDLSSSANFEWGGQTTATPHAEGGGIYKSGLLNYGFQLGRLGDSTQAMLNSNATGVNSGTLFYPQDSFDAIVGSGLASGLKWGAGLHYARSMSNVGSTVNFPQQKARDLSLSGGVTIDPFSAYVKFDLLQDSDTDQASGNSIDYTGKPGGEVGAKLNLDALDAVSLVFNRRLYDFNNGSGTTGSSTDQKIRADFFRQLMKTEKTLLFFTAGLSYDAIDISYNTLGLGAAKLRLFTSPLVIAVEHKALNWLTLRASVAQNVLIDQDKRTDGTNDYDRANLEDTTVAAGMGINVGDFVIDATFEGADNSSGAGGKLNANALAANVALTYLF